MGKLGGKEVGGEAGPGKEEGRPGGIGRPSRIALGGLGGD